MIDHAVNEQCSHDWEYPRPYPLDGTVCSQCGDVFTLPPWLREKCRDPETGEIDYQLIEDLRFYQNDLALALESIGGVDGNGDEVRPHEIAEQRRLHFARRGCLDVHERESNT